MLAANVVIVRISVLLNLNGGAWVNALQQYDAPAFWRLMLTYEPSPDGPFGIIPGVVPLVVVYLLIFVNGRYLHQWLEIRWRRWLTADHGHAGHGRVGRDDRRDRAERGHGRAPWVGSRVCRSAGV